MALFLVEFIALYSIFIELLQIQAKSECSGGYRFWLCFWLNSLPCTAYSLNYCKSLRFFTTILQKHCTGHSNCSILHQNPITTYTLKAPLTYIYMQTHLCIYIYIYIYIYITCIASRSISPHVCMQLGAHPVVCPVTGLLPGHGVYHGIGPACTTIPHSLWLKRAVLQKTLCSFWYSHIQIYIYIYRYTTHIVMCLSIYLSIYLYTCICMYIYTHIHTHIQYTLI